LFLPPGAPPAGGPHWSPATWPQSYLGHPSRRDVTPARTFQSSAPVAHQDRPVVRADCRGKARAHARGRVR
jgi:hypothetical protein